MFKRLQPRGRIQNHARPRTFALNQPQGPVQVRTGFLVDRDAVGARRDEHGRIPVRILDHQVDIQRQPRDAPHRFHHRNANREVGGEMTVHHVQVEHRHSALFHLRDLFA